MDRSAIDELAQTFMRARRTGERLDALPTISSPAISRSLRGDGRRRPAGRRADRGYQDRRQARRGGGLHTAAAKTRLFIARRGFRARCRRANTWNARSAFGSPVPAPRARTNTPSRRCSMRSKPAGVRTGGQPVPRPEGGDGNGAVRILRRPHRQRRRWCSRRSARTGRNSISPGRASTMRQGAKTIMEKPAAIGPEIPASLPWCWPNLSARQHRAQGRPFHRHRLIHRLSPGQADEPVTGDSKASERCRRRSWGRTTYEGLAKASVSKDEPHPQPCFETRPSGAPQHEKLGSIHLLVRDSAPQADLLDPAFEAAGR